MKEHLHQLYDLIDVKNLEHHEMFINLHTSDEYEVVFEILREWLLEGLENQFTETFNPQDIKNLIPSSFIFSSWVLARILKTGRNDIIFNKVKLKQIMKTTDLVKKLNLKSYSDFIFSGLGVCITQLSEQLNLNNEQSCKLLISACLIAAEQIVDHREDYAA